MEWTIGELVERASQALGPAERSNGRVRDVPNERLVRWYATIGLLDPPLARRGRVALYGRRHLLQLIAVKRRQADGRSIAEIQAELTGATDRALETIARLPTDLTADLTAPAASGAAPAAPSFARPRFWAEPPLPASRTGGSRRPVPRDRDSSRRPGRWPPSSRPRTGGSRRPVPRDRDSSRRPGRWPRRPVPGPAAPVSPPAPATAVPALRLAPGVTLLLDGAGRTPSDDDLAAIGAASEALLAVLRTRELAPPEGSP
nr:hypothetical protein GCM10020093_113000 [Planobispora longispora]